MNEYADLFQNNPKPTRYPEETKQDSIAEFEEQLRDHRNNKWAIVLYFLVYVVLIGAMAFYFASLYPDSEAVLQNVDWQVEPGFVDYGMTGAGGESYHEIVLTGVLQNLNDTAIESLQLTVSFLDEDGETLDQVVLTKENFQPGEIWDIEETFYVLYPPFDFTIDGNLFVSNLTNVLFSVAQGLLLIGLFFLMQWKNLWGQIKRFFQSFAKNMGYVVFGVALVFAAVYLGSFLLQILGVSETSQNEQAIQQMFSDDPLVLWMLFFTLCIAAPIMEEIVFRKALFSFIEPKWGLAPAILVSALLFGSMHVLGGGDWIQIIPYALMGSAFGYIYHLSGKNIWVVILMHFFNNFLVFLLYLPFINQLLQNA